MRAAAQATSLWVAGRRADAAMLVSLQSGYGHLSTMQVRAGAVQGLGRHVARLQAANLELFGSPLDAARVHRELAAALEAAGVDEATLRISVVAVDDAALVQGGPVEVALMVALSAPRDAPATAQRVCRHVHARPLAHLKHLATLPLLHARRLARAAGFDDALLVDGQGRISEGALWNVGFVEAGGIVWPEAPALRGTAEAILRDGLSRAQITQRAAPLHLEDARGFRAAFACNSSGLWPLASIDGHRFEGDGGMLERLQALLAAEPWAPVATTDDAAVHPASQGDLPSPGRLPL